MGPEVSNKAPVSVPYRTDIANNYSLSYPSRTLTANASSLNLDAGNNTSFDKRTVVQSKLEVSQPNDVYEQEADFMADAIMRNTYDKDNTFFSNGNNPSIQRFGGAPVSISSDMETQLNVSRGGGHSLPDAFRSKMENSFGADFTGVRIHTDAPAAQMSRDIQAKAFTHGNDIYFNSGQYQPDNSDGRLLLAHELTHVVQQSGMIGRDPDPDTEREIDYSRQISTTQVPQVNMSTLQETTPQALNTPTPEELANDSAKAKKMKREERAEFLFGERSQDALNKKKIYQSEEEARENMERLKVDVWQNSSDLSVGEES
ncbi:MAG: DUF4157 domain-containing protein, partial [Bacteroidales bacterium]|nr:DUF4157 domain-containing protein [Bacteroidales bacterium]